MKVLVTGANGFIGRHWIEQLWKAGATPIATGSRPTPGICAELCQYRQMDITDEEAVRVCIQAERPDAILHAAAISKPDVCEQHHALADWVNVQGTKNLLDAAAEAACSFCFISTDFVFDGARGMYTETDPTAPVNYYGHTKLQAEALVQSHRYNWSIVRTVSVYGQPVPGAANLLSIVAEKLQRGENYSVVDDQVRTPTYAGDLALAVANLILSQQQGIFHVSGEEVLTPYQMAIRTAAHLGLDTGLIRRVTAVDFQQPAKRPPKTGFVIDKVKKAIGFHPRCFQEGLNLCFPR